VRPHFQVSKLPKRGRQARSIFSPNVSELLGSKFLTGKSIDDGDQLAAYLLDEAHVSMVGGNDFRARPSTSEFRTRPQPKI